MSVFHKRSFVLALALALPSAAAAGLCAVDLFREHNPTRPPRILVDPPIRQIVLNPCLDPDPEPPGTRLTFYKVNQQDDTPDPLNAAITLVKAATQVRIHWGGARPGSGACCLAGTCASLTPAECAARGGNFLSLGRSCITTDCTIGACCNGSYGCDGASDATSCAMSFGIFLGIGTSCDDEPLPCPLTGACCTTFDRCRDHGNRAACLGSYAGDGRSCKTTPAPCPSTGACCDPLLGCQDGVHPGDCRFPTQGIRNRRVLPGTRRFLPGHRIELLRSALPVRQLCRGVLRPR